MAESWVEMMERAFRKSEADMAGMFARRSALYQHIATAGASSLDVTPLGSGWDDAMREAAERG